MCFYYADDGAADVYSETRRKARKQHKCDGCSKPVIQPGDWYLYGRYLFDGEWYTIKTCGACELDRWKIHVAELSRGCHHHESWAPIEEASNLIESEYGMERATADEGQRFLVWKEERPGMMAEMSA